MLDFDTGQLVWDDRVAGGKTVEADPVLADLDGDGIDDILIAGHDFKLHALSGRGALGVLK